MQKEVWATITKQHMRSGGSWLQQAADNVLVNFYNFKLKSTAYICGQK